MLLAFGIVAGFGWGIFALPVAVILVGALIVRRAIQGAWAFPLGAGLALLVALGPLVLRMGLNACPAGGPGQGGGCYAAETFPFLLVGFALLALGVALGLFRRRLHL